MAKALTAGIPAVVGVSAPSSLAVSTAERAGQLLLGFARNGDYNDVRGGTSPRNVRVQFDLYGGTDDQCRSLGLIGI